MAGFTLRFKRRFIRFSGLAGFHPRFGCRQFAGIRAGDTLFRLFMTRFTSLLFTLQTCLTRFEAGFGLQRAFRFQIDSAQFRFFLTVILHQRDITRADIGAGTAFDAVINMVGTRFIVIAALAVPVKLLRQQLSRTGIGTGRATNAGLLFVVITHLTGRGRKNTVGNLHHRHIQRWQGKAHQRTAHDHHLTRCRRESHLMQQMADWRAETTPDVTRLGNRLAGQRHDAFGYRFTVDDGPLNRPGGTDVLHQHADIGRTSAMRHFHAGQNAGQLLGTAGRIFGRDHPDLQIALAAQRLFQCGDRFRFIIFNANQYPLCL